MIRKYHLLILMIITIFSLSLIALGVEDDLGGNVKIDGGLLNFSILIGSDVELDFTVPSSGYGTTTARNWQDLWGGRITLIFPAPGKSKVIVSLEDTPRAEKRFFIRVRTEDNKIDFTDVTSEWKYQLPTDITICSGGDVKNVKQLTWSCATQISSQIKYLGEITIKIPVVKAESEPNTENLCRAATWTQIIAGTEEKCINIDSMCNIRREEPEVVAKVLLYKENPCRLTTWTQIIAGTEGKCVDKSSLQDTIPK